MASETLNFNILARDNASKVFDRVGRSAANSESTFKKVSRGMLAVGKVAAVGLGVGVTAGALALKKFTGDARESERVTKLTQAIIKSTGGAAKLTAKQVAELSTSISNKTGVDDEAIQTGSNLLLTFKNVRDEVGKGNKVFSEATAAAVDLSAAGFGSIDSASKMLGKALNDPIKGMTALGRAGVTFTEAQAKQIEQYVKHGDLLKAQKVILGEVQSQVGGAAAATGTATDKLKVKLGNISEEIGSRLLPYIDKAAGWIGERLPGAFDAASGFIGPLLTRLGEVGPKLVEKISGWVTTIKDTFAGIVVNVTPILTSIKDGLAKATGLGADFVNTVKMAIESGNWAPVGEAMGVALAAAIRGAGAAAGKIGEAFNSLMSRIDFVGMGIAIGRQAPALLIGFAAGLLNFDLGGLLSGLWAHWQDILLAGIAIWLTPVKIVGKVGQMLAKIPLVGKFLEWGVNALKGFVDNIAGAIGRAVSGIGNAFLSGFRRVFPGIGAGFAQGLALLPLRVAVAAIDVAEAGVRLMTRLRSAILNRIGSVVAAIGELVGKLVQPFAGIAGKFFSMGADLVRGLVNGIRAMASSAASAALDVVRGAYDAAKGFLKIGSPSKLMMELGWFFAEGFAIGTKKGTERALEAVGQFTDKVASRLQSLRDKARSIMDGVRSAMSGALDVGGLGATTTSTDADGNEVSTTANAASQLSSFAAQSAAFATALRQAIAKGLNPNLIAKVAALGPIQGMTAAQALGALSSAEVAQANAALAQADKIAANLAQTVLSTTPVPEQIAREEKRLTVLQEIREALKGRQTMVSIDIDGKRVAKAIARDIRDELDDMARRRGEGTTAPRR
jgi:flagellar biosynthesis/type III secretory pathway protein FliH